MGLHWFVLSALLVFGIQAAVFHRFGRSRLTYSRHFGVKSAFQGDEIEMIEEIANRKWLPVPWLRVESQFRTGIEFRSQDNLDVSSGSIYQNHKSFFSLMPYVKITRRHKLVCAKRGVYRLSSAALTFGDVMGIRSGTIRKELDGELVVYPLPAALSELPFPSHSWQGDISVRRWIVDDPFMIAGVREYRHGDPLKGINWKATARSGRLQVHQLDYTADHRLMIVLNVEDHEGMWEQLNDEPLVERGLSLSAGMAAYAITQGLDAGFAVNAPITDKSEASIMMLPEGGHGHLDDLYEAMARMLPQRTVPVHLLLEELAEAADRRLDIALLSAYYSPRMELAVERLRERGHAVDWYRMETTAAEPSGKGATA